MKVLALIADIVKSKKIAEREKLQDKLNEYFASLTRPGIISPYTITLGDEFQAVYAHAAGIFQDIIEILKISYPAQMRFSLALATLSTKINPERSIGMDGPAFHMARDRLIELKGYDEIIIQIQAEEGFEVVNSSLKLASSAMSGWKENTWKIISGIMAGQSVKEISAEIGISERAVYKGIDTHVLKDYIEYFKAIEKKLGQA
jgi:hypothetical protein